MGLGTKDVPESTGGGLPKTIQPGSYVLKINNVELKHFPFMEKDGYFMMLNVETKLIENFEGFFIDKDDESKGRYEGQIGQIKTNRYYYKDGETKSGVKINRDMEMLKQLRNMCMACDAMDWFKKVDNKYDTIEEFIEAFNKEAPYKDKFFNFCVAGKEFERKNGYTGYDLFFPKLNRGTVAFELEDTKTSKIITFSEADHWQKLEPKEKKEFGGDGEEATPAADGESPAAGAPEFEL